MRTLNSIVCLFMGHDDSTKSLVTTRSGERFMWAHVCNRCGRCKRADEMYQDQAKTESDPHGSVSEVSGIPCSHCCGPVREFWVPSDIWNAVVRRGGKEHDDEYLCSDCYHEYVTLYVARHESALAARTPQPEEKGEKDA